MHLQELLMHSKATVHLKKSIFAPEWSRWDQECTCPTPLLYPIAVARGSSRFPQVPAWGWQEAAGLLHPSHVGTGPNPYVARNCVPMGTLPGSHSEIRRVLFPTQGGRGVPAWWGQPCGDRNPPNPHVAVRHHPHQAGALLLAM